MAAYAKPIEFKQFAGLRNTTSPERLSLADLRFAENVDIDDANRITRRAGRTSRNATASHSLWSDGTTCLVVQGTSLKRVRAVTSTTYALDTLRSDLTPNARMSYWSVNGLVYYSNGFETGIVQENASRSWGLLPPVGQPGAQVIGGGLPAGTYRFALTYLRRDRQESGTDLAATIELRSKGGIRFSGIPVSDDPTVDAKAIYLTPTNAETLYRAIVIPNATTAADYHNAGYDLRLKLNTQFGQPAPAGQLVSYFRGHTLVASGPVLWRSEAYRYELFMLRKGFNVFGADINLIAPVEDGVFIGADRTYFLAGVDPAKWVLTTVADYPAIHGTLAYAEGGNVGDGLPGKAAMWASPRGHCIGTNGGSFRNLTEARFSYPNAQRGAGILRQVNGINQYLAVLEGSGVANNAQS